MEQSVDITEDLGGRASYLTTVDKGIAFQAAAPPSVDAERELVIKTSYKQRS